MGSINLYISTVVLLVLPSLMLSCGAAPEPQVKVSVAIVNDLGDGIPLHIHCKSKDDDFGYVDLNFQESFSWRFFPNLFPTTLYWCSMQWKSAQGWVTGSFEVYNEKHDRKICHTECDWSIRPDAAYRYDQRIGQYVVLHKWW